MVDAGGRSTGAHTDDREPLRGTAEVGRRRAGDGETRAEEVGGWRAGDGEMRAKL